MLASYGLIAEGAAIDSPLVDHLPATADELVRRTGLSAAEVARALVELELAGAASAHEGVYRLQ